VCSPMHRATRLGATVLVPRVLAPTRHLPGR
jgi:hypothetical protein